MIAGAGLMAEIARNCPQSRDAIVPSSCTSLIGQYTSSFQTPWWWVTAAGIVIPALVGLFVGVPLIATGSRARTHRLIWDSQGVTRRRWVLSKIGLVALGVVVGSTALALAGQGWFSMQHGLGSLGNQSVRDGFEIAPPVPTRHHPQLFALALGVAAGVLLQTSAAWPGGSFEMPGPRSHTARVYAASPMNRSTPNSVVATTDW